MVSVNGEYTVRVYNFEHYRVFILEKRVIIQKLLDRDKPLSPSQRAQLMSEVTPGQLEQAQRSLELFGGGTSCGGEIKPPKPKEGEDPERQQTVSVTVTISYDTQNAQWGATCGSK